MNTESPWARAGGALPWSHPEANPLADMAAHIRQAEENYQRDVAAIAAHLNAQGVRRPVQLTAAEHLAAAADSLRDAGRDLVLAAKVGARQAGDRLRRFLDDLPVEL